MKNTGKPDFARAYASAPCQRLKRARSELSPLSLLSLPLPTFTPRPDEALRWVVIALVAALLSLVEPPPAQAADTWTQPFPGVKVLHRTGPKKLNLYAAVVDLCQAGVSVRHTAFSERAQKTSSFAKKVGAQLAINGDFSCRPIDVNPKTSPFKPCVNKPKYVTYGIAAHAGSPWPSTLSKDALLAFGNERAQIWDDAEDKEFDPDWMQEVISGHWSLVLNGKLTIADCPIDPRTAIGLSADGNTLVMAVVDGRNGWRGMTCKEVGAVLIELGADRAFNLDGGGSSTFWQQGKGVRNNPSDGVERVVGPHLAIYAKGSGASPHCERPSVLDLKAPLPPVQVSGAPGWLEPVSPTRVFDTRTTATSKALKGLQVDGKGKMKAGTKASWSDPKWLPKGTVGAVLNLTVVSAEAPGFLTAWPLGQVMPDVSVLNYRAEAALANLGVVPGPGAQLYSYSATHLIGDLQARFSPTGGGFMAGTPYRLLDTRTKKQPLQPQQVRTIVPASAGTQPLALGVTAVGTKAAGFVTVFPCGGPTPNISNLNFTAGDNRANLVIVTPSSSGVCAVSSAETHMLVDVFGSFSASGGARWQPIKPVRVIDTRKPKGRWTGKLAVNKAMPLNFFDMPGFPKDAKGVTLNLTAVAPRADGFLAWGPCGAPPKTSNLNFRENHNTAVAAWMPLPTSGTLCLTASARTHVLVDVSGIFVTPPAPPITDAGGGPDTVGPDTVGADTAGSDTKAPDTNVPDTNVPDTNVPDTNVPDTNVPDTNVPDTNVPDTNNPDTSNPDTVSSRGDATPADAAAGDTSWICDAAPMDTTAMDAPQNGATDVSLDVATPRMGDGRGELSDGMNSSGRPDGATPALDASAGGAAVASGCTGGERGRGAPSAFVLLLMCVLLLLRRRVANRGRT